MSNQISEEKLAWLKEVGAEEFGQPMKWHIGRKHLYSEEHIKNTSLEELKGKYEKTLRKCPYGGYTYNGD